MTKQEASILAFEEDHRGHTRTKEARIREAFGLSPARYYQIRNRLARRADALAAHPWLPRQLASEQTSGLRRGLLR
jgi:hypothetical protein